MIHIFLFWQDTYFHFKASIFHQVLYLGLIEIRFGVHYVWKPQKYHRAANRYLLLTHHSLTKTNKRFLPKPKVFSEKFLSHTYHLSCWIVKGTFFDTKQGQTKRILRNLCKAFGYIIVKASLNNVSTKKSLHTWLDLITYLKILISNALQIDANDRSASIEIILSGPQKMSILFELLSHEVTFIILN